MNQPTILQWNIAQLAQCLLPLIDDDPDTAVNIAQEIINEFPDVFSADLGHAFAQKLGLNENAPDALKMGLDLLKVMEPQQADFTLTFRTLEHALEADGNAETFLSQFNEPDSIGEWLKEWRQRVTEDNESMTAARRRLVSTNPAVIARNHLVEAVIRAAEDRADYVPLHDMLAMVTNPFVEPPEGSKYGLPPRPDEEVRQTFCGT